MRATISNLMNRFRRDEKGVTLVEYGIALVLAVVVGGTALNALATSVTDTMDEACNSIGTTTAGGAYAAGTTGC